MLLAFAIISVSACLVAGLIFNDRAVRRREVDAKFRSIIIVNAEGEVDFDGLDAIVLGRHSTFIGGDMEASDGRLQAKYLCKNVNGCGFLVVVEGSSGVAAASTKVTKLDEAEFKYFHGRYPFKKGLRRSA